MLRRTYFSLLFMIAIVGALIFHKTTRFNYIFDIFLIGVFVLTPRILKINYKLSVFLLINLFYVFVSFIWAIAIYKANILDFILVFKAYIYLLPLSIMVNKKFLTPLKTVKYIKFFIVIFFLKYTISTIVNPNLRPTLFVENNFELMFLALIFYLFYIIEQKVSLRWQGMFLIIFLLSFSISGLLTAFFVLVAINKQLLKKKLHWFLVFAPVIVLIIAQVIKFRLGGGLDFTQNVRYLYLTVFLEETQQWGVFDFLFGSPPITPLSEGGCESLSYWQMLFSFSGNGTCYSVILHSFFFRAIFDHGIIGLLFLVFYTFKIIKQSGYTNHQSFVVLGIAFINALSVSSFNSIFFIIGLLFYVATRPPHEKQNKIFTGKLTL